MPTELRNYGAEGVDVGAQTMSQNIRDANAGVRHRQEMANYIKQAALQNSVALAKELMEKAAKTVEFVTPDGKKVTQTIVDAPVFESVRNMYGALQYPVMSHRKDAKGNYVAQVDAGAGSHFILDPNYNPQANNNQQTQQAQTQPQSTANAQQTLSPQPFPSMPQPNSTQQPNNAPQTTSTPQTASNAAPSITPSPIFAPANAVAKNLAQTPMRTPQPINNNTQSNTQQTPNTSQPASNTPSPAQNAVQPNTQPVPNTAPQPAPNNAQPNPQPNSQPSAGTGSNGVDISSQLQALMDPNTSWFEKAKLFASLAMNSKDLMNQYGISMNDLKKYITGNQ